MKDRPPDADVDGVGTSPSVVDSPRARALHSALEIVGSKQVLAQRLNVSPADLEDWLAGRSEPSHALFIKALNIVARGNRS